MPIKEYRQSSTIYLSSALGEGEWSTPHIGLFTAGKDSDPFYRRLGWTVVLSGRVRKISPPPGFDPLTVQPVASRHNGCAIPPHVRVYKEHIDQGFVFNICTFNFNII